MGKLWLPTEVEIFGNVVWSNKTWGVGGGGCNKQYPIFIGGTLHLIKGIGNDKNRKSWWTASVQQGSAAYVCFVNAIGYSSCTAATQKIYIPLCFRIG